ncbi:unnamed protein product [Ambrosiozyma monospora]|uniref:Unnamed protein product n=1 Tax=Ambrosiozyma monospora TaxID=43982 RepID=A0A9W6TAN5_AMBMO|nr:unnamed protein product [Ambrosiozyma monospora]
MLLDSGVFARLLDSAEFFGEPFGGSLTELTVILANFSLNKALASPIIKGQTFGSSISSSSSSTKISPFSVVICDGVPTVGLSLLLLLLSSSSSLVSLALWGWGFGTYVTVDSPG